MNRPHWDPHNEAYAQGWQDCLSLQMSPHYAQLATLKGDEYEQYKALYVEAMIASNEAGFVGFNIAQTIRELAAMVKEQP